MTSRNIRGGTTAPPINVRVGSWNSCKFGETIWNGYPYVVFGLHWRFSSPLPNFEM